VGANLGTSQPAVVSGPPTGFPAVLSGETAVIPANAGSEASAAAALTTSTSHGASDVINMMTQKVERFTEVAQTNLRNVRNTVSI
jgi:hypothetical protein